MDFSTPVFQLTYEQISRYIKPHAWSGLHKSFLDTMGNPHKIRIIGWRHEGVLLLCLRHLTLRFQQPLITAEPKKSFMIKHIHNLLAVMWSVVVTGGHGWSRVGHGHFLSARNVGVSFGHGRSRVGHGQACREKAIHPVSSTTMECCNNT